MRSWVKFQSSQKKPKTQNHHSNLAEQARPHSQWPTNRERPTEVSEFKFLSDMDETKVFRVPLSKVLGKV